MQYLCIIEILIEICDRMIPTLVHDLEVMYGMIIMHRIAGCIMDRRRPSHAQNETSKKAYGDGVAVVFALYAASNPYANLEKGYGVTHRYN